MQKCLLVLFLLSFATLGWAGGAQELKYEAKPPPAPVQFRFWLGTVINPEGIGPKADVEVRWGPRFGVKLGLASARVKDWKCHGKRCAEFVHASGWKAKPIPPPPAPDPPPGHALPYSSWSPSPPPPIPLLVEDTGNDWQLDLMFSWTRRQR